MKKLRKKELAIGIVLALALAFGMSNCNKINPADTPELQQSEFSRDPAETRILNFLDALQTDGLKSTEEYEKEEGIWLLESSFNYVFVDPISEGEELIRGEVKIPLCLSGGKVNASQLCEVYAKFSDSLYAKAAEYSLENLYLDGLNLEWVTEDETTYLRMDYAFGGGSYVSNHSGDFGSEDWWWYGMGMGRCNGTVCCAGKDAATQLMWKSSLNIAYPVGHSYFTDIEAVMVTNPKVLPPNSGNPNYCFYPLFFNINQPPFDTNFHMCLSPFEMNYYYNQIQQIIPAYKPLADPTNPGLGYKTYAGVIVLPSSYTNAQGDLVVEHMALILYGISHTSTNWQAHQW